MPRQQRWPPSTRGRPWALCNTRAVPRRLPAWGWGGVCDLGCPSSLLCLLRCPLVTPCPLSTDLQDAMGTCILGWVAPGLRPDREPHKETLWSLGGAHGRSEAGVRDLIVSVTWRGRWDLRAGVELGARGGGRGDRCVRVSKCVGRWVPESPSTGAAGREVSVALGRQGSEARSCRAGGASRCTALPRPPHTPVLLVRTS